MFSEQCDVRVEVEEDSIVLLFSRRMDTFMTPWQDAWNLGLVLERAAGDVPNNPLVVNPQMVNAEQAQIRLNTYQDKYVVLLFDWTDRIKLFPMAAKLVAAAIKVKAQDLDLLHNKRVRMVYDKNGRGVPHCLESTRIVMGPPPQNGGS